jgi:hypothetical protein
LDIAYPDIPAEFSVINLNSEQPRHHQVVKVIAENKDKRIYTAQCNASLDDLPHKPTGVSAAVDEIEVDNWTNPPEEDDFYHNLPTQPMIVVPPTPILDKDIANNETVNTKAAK